MILISNQRIKMTLLKKTDSIETIIKQAYQNLFAGFFDRDEVVDTNNKCARIILMSPTTCRDTYTYQIAQAWLEFKESV